MDTCQVLFEYKNLSQQQLASRWDEIKTMLRNHGYVRGEPIKSSKQSLILLVLVLHTITQSFNGQMNLYKTWIHPGSGLKLSFKVLMCIFRVGLLEPTNFLFIPSFELRILLFKYFFKNYLINHFFSFTSQFHKYL